MDEHDRRMAIRERMSQPLVDVVPKKVNEFPVGGHDGDLIEISGHVCKFWYWHKGEWHPVLAPGDV